MTLLWEDQTRRHLLASARLYFLPEDTPKGRTREHGEVLLGFNLFLLPFVCFYSVESFLFRKLNFVFDSNVEARVSVNHLIYDVKDDLLISFSEHKAACLLK